MTLLPRTVFVELITALALSLAGLSSVMMAGGVMVEAARRGLDPAQAIALAPLLVPPTLPFIVPVCLLFACTIVYGRMSAHVEITALKSSGVHPLSVLWPALALGLFVAGTMAVLADGFIPACHRKIAERIVGDLRTSLCGYLRQTGFLAEPDVPYEIYVRGVRGHTLIDPIFKHKSPAGGYDLVIQAADATLGITSVLSRSEIPDMILWLRMREGIASTPRGRSIHFQDRTERLPLPDTARREDNDLRSLRFAECLERSALRQRQARYLRFDLADALAGGAMQGDIVRYCEEAPHQGVRAARFERKSREALAEFHVRLAQSAVAAPFALLGAAISILLQRKDFLQLFFVGFLPVVLVYYPLTLLSVNLVKEGAVPQPWIVWLPAGLLVAACAPLLARVRRY